MERGINEQVNMNEIVKSHDLVFITFDTLRYDVAQQLFLENQTPNLANLIGKQGWEKRHTPGSFTYAAHHAFFSGFLPTPARPGNHPRLFATKFVGSETTTKNTVVFNAADIVTGLHELNYHSICIGGVGFFNKQTPLSQVFPSLFKESHWNTSFGVTDPKSTENQFRFAAQRMTELAENQKLFLFINLSAIHQPNYFYLEEKNDQHIEDQSEEKKQEGKNKKSDNIGSHAAALKYIDSQISILVEALEKRTRPNFCIFCGDHGTTYGEDGYRGHRLAHPKVWNVPYAQFKIE